MILLKRFLQKNREKRLNIHCVGDAMIDEYYDVKVNRISPEFPMPIMWSSHDKPLRRPGGVANAAYQFKHFNTDVVLFSFCDSLGAEVFKDHELYWKTPYNVAASLPVKRRFLDNGIQVVRHDIESPLCGLDEHSIDFGVEVLAKQIEASPQPDIAILSDYNKGIFSSEETNLLHCYHGVKTIVDPKRGPLSRWKGCTIFKPNAKEAIEFTGRTQWREQAKHLENALECEAVVITFGGDRVAGVWKGDFFDFRPTKSVLVESVVGAGDCFGAFFAMAIGHGFTIPEAAEIAWNAGAIYVQNRRNRPIVPAELSPDGIVQPEDLVNRDFKLVFTNGCFDLIHEGHLATLSFAKEKGEKLVVALNSDESVQRLKGPNRPVKPLEQRMAVMASLKMVDYVVSFDEDTPLELIKRIKPDVLVKGGDYKTSEIVGVDIVPEVFRAPFIKGHSVTRLLG